MKRARGMSEDIKQAVLLLNEVIDSIEEELRVRRMIGGASKKLIEDNQGRLSRLQAARTLLLYQIEPITPNAVVTNYSQVEGFTVIDEVEQ
jgi:hypothetical protein